MERLWRPWRMDYVSNQAGKSEGCIFCTESGVGDDDDAGILHRGERCFVILNKYPYNTGHLMIAPLRHAAELSDLDAAEQAEMMALATASVEALRSALDAEGFNIGINLGRAAGAGVPGHLHIHVVPRWGGDTNFMPVVGGAKVMPELLTETAARLRPLFAP